MSERKRELWLGVRDDEFRPSGKVSRVRLVDGAHSDPTDVAEAKKLLRGIFPARYGETNFVIVELLPVPDEDPPVNEEAMESCAALVARFGSREEV